MATDANGVLKRPSFGDDFVRRRAAELALPDVREWLGADSQRDIDVMKDLMNVLSCGDGYEICRDLEKLGWAVNSELVTVFDMGDFIETAKTEMVVQWVKCLGVKLDLPLGAPVDYRGRLGTVVKLFPDTAEYGIHTGDQPANMYHVCAAEEVRAAATLPLATEAVV
jgi:hypothetical protein